MRGDLRVVGSVLVSSMPDEQRGKDGYFMQDNVNGRFLGSVFRDGRGNYMFYADTPVSLSASILRDLQSFVEELNEKEQGELIRN